MRQDDAGTLLVPARPAIGSLPSPGVRPSPGGRATLPLILGIAVLVVVAPRLPAPVGPTATVAALAFVSLIVESLPFLMVGAILAAGIQRLPTAWIGGVSARHPVLAPVLAPLAGVSLPLCDCGLIPLARRLHEEGGSQSVVNGFVSGAPLANPVVILSTLVAFPGRPGMVIGRVAVGIGVAWLVAAIGPRPGGSPPPPTDPHHGIDAAHSVHGHCDPPTGLLPAAGTEFSRTVPTLVAGALLAGLVKALVPADALTALSAQPLLGAAAMMLLAFVLAICSQADAFVASSLPVGNLPRLTFLVLGPMLDIRLAALYRREFGTRWVTGYAAVVVPAVLVLATLWATWGPS